MLRFPLVSTLMYAALSSAAATAQDQRDEDIFGGSEPAPAAAADPQSRAQGLEDTLQIGGRLEIRSNTGQEEQQKLPAASFTQLKTADIYFDARPNKDMRIFLRQRFEERTPATPSAAVGGGSNEPNAACTNCIESKIDELWFKWDLNDQVFFTYGKQHLKWGSSRFWNPTDFTALEVRDPFALFDRRLGTELLKVHVPQEKSGNNHYAIVQFDRARRNDDFLLALRSELTVGSSAEFALSAQTGRSHPQRIGADISSALGPFDVNLEAATSKRQQRQFFEGTIDPEAAQLPVAFEDQGRWFNQASGGLRQTIKYSAEDNFSWGLEYFWNELGYEQRELELYSLVLSQSQPLYAGRRYAGAYLLLPTPGSWNETSFFANAIGNLSDKTYVGRVTATWEIVDAATLEVFASRCFGEYGELCFKVPESYKVFAQLPGVSDQVKEVVARLPTRRTLFNAGVSLSLVF